jgi:2-methylcitrate dehydratase PrpD
MNDLTEQLADDLYCLSKAELADRVVQQAKRCVLDYLGVTLAGAEMLRVQANSLLDYLGAGHGSVSAMGLDRKTTIENAALVKGLCAHLAELDDGVRFGMMHPGAPIMSALLPLAEQTMLSGLILGNLGIVGLYLGRLYDEVKARPLYVIQQALNIDKTDGTRF